MKRGVVAELRLGQPVKPVARTVVSDAAEVHGDHFVHRFGLAIGLRMEGRAHAQLYPGKPEQVSPHTACEDGVAVGDDRLRKAVELDDVGEKRASDGGCRVWVSQRNEVRVLREPVHHGE